MIRKKEHVLNGIFFIFSIFPLIPNKVKGLPVILLFLAALFFYEKSKINWKWLLINSSLLIVYLISISYSSDYLGSFKKLETSLSIIIIPISFFVLLSYFKITDKIKLNFIKGFVVSTAIFSITSFLYIIYNYASLNNKWSTDRYRNLVLDMPAIGQHPIYASIFISLAVIFIVYIFKNRLIKNSKEKLIFSILTGVNILLLLFLLSKGVILVLFIIIISSIVFGFMKRIYKYLIIAALSLSMIFLFVYNRRMSELIKAQTYETFNPNLSTSIRLGIYDCSLEIIKKNFLIGFGIGDAQRELNLCYANKSDILLMHRFNSHNQYLDITIKTGVIGLTIFLFFLMVNLKHALKNKNELLLMTLALYCLLFLFENVLSRQSGVILFFFLISFFNNPIRLLTKNNHQKTIKI